MLENITYKHPLIIGTGGGNDIVSATLILADLQKNGTCADLAGICSPGALHFYDSVIEKPINLVSCESKRFIESKLPRELSFIDSQLPAVLQSQGFNCKVYNLSGRYGTSRLIESLQDLIKKEKYDGVVAVDIGGDILARANNDRQILSPLMDFTTLYAVSQLESPSVLVEFGLQTDGELRPKGCQEIIQELRENKILLEETRMYKENLGVRKFQDIYNSLRHIREGHTAVMTLKTLEEVEDIKTEYRFKVQVLDKKALHHFPLTLESKYFGNVFTFDLKKLAKRRERAFPYRDNLDLYLKTKKIMDTKTEMDTLYYNNSGNVVWLGLICPQITGDPRRELLNFGLDNLASHADTALLWKKDDSASIRIKRFVRDIDEFIITGDSNEKVNDIRDKIYNILG